MTKGDINESRGMERFVAYLQYRKQLGGEMNRGKAITGLCIVFGLFTLAGIGDSLVMLSGKVEGIPSWLGYFALIFGISAGGVSIGLWRMNRWGLLALRFWFVACLMLFLASAFAFYSAIPGGITLVVIVAVVLVGIFLALDRFVSSRFEIDS